MHIAILLLTLCNNLIYSNAFKECCQGQNIIVNGTCWDGSNITSLDCRNRTFVGFTPENPAALEIDVDDDNLIIEYFDKPGHYRVEPNKYCITGENENDTNLALVCVEDDEILTDTTDVVFFYLKTICGFISTAFLLTVLIVYVFTPELRDIEGIGIISFVASLLLGFVIIFLIPAFVLIDPYPCNTVSFLYYTGITSAINWMCVLSFHLWKITIRPIFQTHMKWTIVYCCYGYGLPLLLITTSVLDHYMRNLNLDPGENQCLMDLGSVSIYAYFYGPIMLIIFISVVLQVWVAKKVWIDIDRRDQSQYVVRLRKKSLMYGHLLLVTGTSYILDTISYITLAESAHLEVFWLLCDCRTLLLGGVIFFIFIVLRNKVLKALAKKGLFCIKFPKRWEKLIDEESEHVEAEETVLTRDSAGL